MTVKRYQLDPALEFLAPVIVPDLLRMGKDYDGGYIISERSVAAASGMLSFGVNDDWSFDQQWSLRKPQDKIHAYDGTISPGRMRSDLQQSYREFFGGTAVHFPVNVAADSGLGHSSFADAMHRMNRDQVFLKMDIEGGEWQLTDSIIEHAAAITGMVIEFHHTDRLRPLFCGTVQRYQEHFHVIHVHPNTSCALAADNFPTVVELTFLNKNLWNGADRRRELHVAAMDQANLPGTDDIALYFD